MWAQLRQEPLEPFLHHGFQAVDALEHVEEALAKANTRADGLITDFLVFRRRKYFGVVSLSTVLRHVSFLRSEEMARARVIQEHLMNQCDWNSPYYEVHFYLDLAYELGGDFYYRVGLGPGRELIACFDVSGKNISAALSTSTIAAFFSTLELRGDLVNIDVTELVALLNSVLHTETPVDMFVAAILVFVDQEERTIQVFNHGYSPLYVVRYGGPAPEIDSWQVVSAAHGVGRLMPEFQPLGIEPSIEGLAGAAELPFGSRMALFSCSDGLFDAHSPTGQVFGDRRVEQLVLQATELTADQVIPRVKRTVSDFVADAPRADDITAFYLQFP